MKTGQEVKRRTQAEIAADYTRKAREARLRAARSIDGDIKKIEAAYEFLSHLLSVSDSPKAPTETESREMLFNWLEAEIKARVDKAVPQ